MHSRRLHRTSVGSLLALLAMVNCCGPTGAGQTGPDAPDTADGNTLSQPTPTIAPRKRALVVGINHYQYLRTQPLDFAENGAHTVTNLLRQQNVDVEELLGEEASGANIMRHLTSMLTPGPAGALETDDVLFFFSGHGDGTGEHKASKAYLIAQDCNPNNPGPSCVSLGAIASLAANTNVRSFLAVLDACYAGAFGATKMSSSSGSAQSYEKLAREKARQVLTAGGPGEQVYMVPSLRMSIFTKYFTDGLQGQAFRSSNDGLLLTTELSAYVKNQILNDPIVKGAQIPRLYEQPLATGEFLFRRGIPFTPTPVGPPPPAIPLRYAPRFGLVIKIEGSAKKYDSYTESKDFYRRTPGDNCIQAVPISESLSVKDGYSLKAGTVSDIQLRGDRTKLDPIKLTASSASVTGLVQGDNDFIGFCKRPGEASFKITVSGERWEAVKLPTFESPSAESDSLTWAVQYPNLPSSSNHKDVVLSYEVAVTRRDGDLVRTFTLTEANQEGDGVKTLLTSSGRLVVDAKQAAPAPMQ